MPPLCASVRLAAAQPRNLRVSPGWAGSTVFPITTTSATMNDFISLRRRPDVRRRWLSVREIAARGGRALRLLRHAEFVDLTAQSSLFFDVRHGQVAEWLKAPV